MSTPRAGSGATYGGRDDETGHGLDDETGYDEYDSADSATSAAPPFAVTRSAGNRDGSVGILDGGTILSAAERRFMLRHRLANPDDPIVRAPPQDARGPRPGPDFLGAPGRIAIVQAQVYLVGVLLILQLFLITTALYELLSGQTNLLWWLALANLVIFLLTLVIALWPRQRVRGF
ncbi:MAG: hypothetical protein ABI068_13215 [Ktedonobacterales bacterium]